MIANGCATFPIRDLVLIPELTPRDRLNEETIIRYMESFPALPPIRVQKGSGVVVDGYHRVEAAIRLGLEEVPAEVEAIPDEELRVVAGLANVQHGQPLSRPERNRLAVALVRNYGKLREEVATLLGMSQSAVTLALREHQFNEMLSEKLGAPVQVINSSHVRALYRVGPEQRERLLEAVVSKVDEDGRPYPLTGAELKLLVDRMLDPATPNAELNRLLSDPQARPRPAGPASGGEAGVTAREDAVDPFLPEPGNTRPWEREWESPLKSGDGEAFDGPRSVDDQIAAEHARFGDDLQKQRLLDRAEANVVEQSDARDWGPSSSDPLWQTPPPEVVPQREQRLCDGIKAAFRALTELAPQVEPEPVRRQLEAVTALLEALLD